MHPHDLDGGLAASETPKKETTSAAPVVLPLRDQLTDTAGFARLACLSETYARQLRVIGGGPRFIKLTAKTVRYRVGDILDWVASRPNVASTSELEAA